MTNIPEELKAPEAVAERTRAYYQTISAKGKEVIRERKAAGETMHLAPLGWLNARDENGRSIIVPDPERYELVQEAKRLHKDGLSIRKICKLLGEKGFRTKRGKQVSPGSLWLGINTNFHILE